MKLIVGLGNPGEKYESTRHNVGFMALNSMDNGKWTMDKKANSQFSILNSQLTLAKPQTFMNESGKAIKFLCQKHKLMPEDVLVIHDDLDIPLGSYKLQFGKGPRLHNGVTSVENHLGTKDFWRLRVGIENRGQKAVGQQVRSTGEDYVLSKFSKEELNVLDSLTTQKLIPELHNWISAS